MAITKIQVGAIPDASVTHAKLHTTMDLSSKTVTLPTINALDVTNNISVGGTVDGIDIATRDAILTSTTTTAGAALPKAGGAMTGDVSHGDGVKAKFGAGDDFSIHSGGTHTIFKNNNASGNVYFQTDTVVHFTNGANTEEHLTINDDGAVTLYHNNAAKLATTATGVETQGRVMLSGADNHLRFNGDSSTPLGECIHRPAAGNIAIVTSSGERMRIDNSGNVGIGVVPEAWWSGYQALDIGNAALTGRTGTNIGYFSANAYDDGVWKYKTTDEASLIVHIDGTISHKVAPSGAADSAISWNTAMTVANSGIVTKPYQPAFRAYQNTDPRTNGYLTSANSVSWVDQGNTGSHFSGGTFTAPVSGWYHFSVIWDSLASNAALSLYINLVAFASWEPTGRIDDSWESRSYSTSVYMNTNDYAQLYLSSASGTNPVHMGTGRWGSFSGHLIG